MKFPSLIGVDAAGTVIKIGPGVEEFSIGDRVFAIADGTYAELCVMKAAALAKVPEGLDLIEAAALPLVTTTGYQLVGATEIKAGETVLVIGAAGSVGRSAVFAGRNKERCNVSAYFDRSSRCSPGGPATARSLHASA
jgi:NADPH:quinone reductase-like Zn-dependent oxidoreductase